MILMYPCRDPFPEPGDATRWPIPVSLPVGMVTHQRSLVQDSLPPNPHRSQRPIDDQTSVFVCPQLAMSSATELLHYVTRCYSYVTMLDIGDCTMYSLFVVYRWARDKTDGWYWRKLSRPPPRGRDRERRAVITGQERRVVTLAPLDGGLRGLSRSSGHGHARSIRTSASSGRAAASHPGRTTSAG
jgi:hypothetical protein